MLGASSDMNVIFFVDFELSSVVIFKYFFVFLTCLLILRKVAPPEILHLSSLSKIELKEPQLALYIFKKTVDVCADVFNAFQCRSCTVAQGIYRWGPIYH